MSQKYSGCLWLASQFQLFRARIISHSTWESAPRCLGSGCDCLRLPSPPLVTLIFNISRADNSVLYVLVREHLPYEFIARNGTEQPYIRDATGRL